MGDFFAQKRGEGCTNNTLNAYVKVLRKYGEFIDNDELRKIKYLPKNQAKVSTLTDKEIEIFLEIDDTQPTKSLFFSILAYTGMRPIEANNLTVDDIQFASNSIRILATKTQTYRTIPIPQPIKESLRQHCNTVDYKLFRGYSAQVLYQQFHKRLNMMGIKRKGLHVYSLRHSYATRMVDADCDPFSVKELLGHSDLKMTERYYHLSAKRLQKVSKRDPMAQKRLSYTERLEILKQDLCILLEGFNYSINQTKTSLSIEIRGSPQNGMPQDFKPDDHKR